MAMPPWPTKANDIFCTQGKAYPTREQRHLIKHWCGMARGTWNMLLDVYYFQGKLAEARKANDLAAMAALELPARLAHIADIVYQPELTVYNQQKKRDVTYPAYPSHSYYTQIIQCYYEAHPNPRLVEQYRATPAEALYAQAANLAKTHQRFLGLKHLRSHLRYKDDGTVTVIGLPRYKSKRDSRQSISLDGERADGRSKPKRFNSFIKLPKPLGLQQRPAVLKTRGLRPCSGRITGITITYDGRRDYGVTVRYRTGEPQQHRQTGHGIVALDMTAQKTEVAYAQDASTVFTLSQRHPFPAHVHALDAQVNSLKSAQSRYAKGTAAYRSYQRRINTRQRKITRCYLDYYHRLTNALIAAYDTIMLEDLATQSMLESANTPLAKLIQDSRFSLFKSLLSYKIFQTHSSFVFFAPPYYPSTQLCSVCDTKAATPITLSMKTWHCGVCGTTHHRDYNAACNLYKLAEAHRAHERQLANHPEERVRRIG